MHSQDWSQSDINSSVLDDIGTRIDTIGKALVLKGVLAEEDLRPMTRKVEREVHDLEMKVYKASLERQKQLEETE